METNELNISLQEINAFIFIIRERISAFQLKFWTKSVESRKSECFPNEFQAESETKLEETIFSDVIQHLNGLQHTSFNYFPFITNDGSCMGKFIFSYGDTQHVNARL
jgi:hypothetical protein